MNKTGLFVVACLLLSTFSSAQNENTDEPRSPEEIIQAFFETLSTEGSDSAARKYMTRDFSIITTDGTSFNREIWLQTQKMWEGVFPDMLEQYKVDSIVGNKVYGTHHVSATHSKDVDLTRMGLGVALATGNNIHVMFNNVFTISENRILSIQSLPTPESGTESLLRQLGFQVPGQESDSTATEDADPGQ